MSKPTKPAWDNKQCPLYLYHITLCYTPQDSILDDQSYENLKPSYNVVQASEMFKVHHWLKIISCQHVNSCTWVSNCNHRQGLNYVNFGNPLRLHTFTNITRHVMQAIVRSAQRVKKWLNHLCNGPWRPLRRRGFHIF
jgi:hypothetical protein